MRLFTVQTSEPPLLPSSTTNATPGAYNGSGVHGTGYHESVVDTLRATVDV